MEGGEPSVPVQRRERSSVDCVLEDLKELYARSGLERTLAIGELLLTRFFEGSPAVWKSRRRNKNNSIRRLAARKDCPLRRSALNDAIAVFAAVSATPSVRTYGHIGTSHVAAAATLQADQRADLLRTAEARRWTVRQLKEEIVNWRRLQGDRRGRPPSTGDTKLLTAIVSAVARLERAMDLLDAGLQGHRPSAGICEQAQSLGRRLHAVADLLERVAPVHAPVRLAVGDASASPQVPRPRTAS